MKQYIISKINKYSSEKISLVGGKAIGLWKFKELNTPKWFVLTTDFFEEIYGKHQDNINTLVVNEDYSALERLIMLEPIKEKFQNIVLRNTKYNKKYAVRSSAIDEDSKNASFAGAMSTYLNITQDALLTYIKKCYLSAFTKKALAYRKTNNLSSINIKMAVIVQEMIEADASGVVNTINPITNNPDEIVISATEGLGESLVSGEVNGIDYYVNRDKIIGNNPLLSEKVIKDIVKLCSQILSKSTSFQDIEFAVKEEKVYFLQTRPIVPYQHIDITEPRTTYDNANIIESYSGVTTMLTYTFARYVYSKIYHQTLKAGHIRQKVIDNLSPYLNDMLRFYDNKIYYNLNSWYMLTSIFPGKKNNISYMENMMGVKTKLTKAKHVKMSIFDLMNLGLRLKYRLDHMQKLSKKFINKFDEVVMPYLGSAFENYSAKRLMEIYKEIEENIVDDFTTPIINDVGAMMYYGKLTKYVKKLNISDPDGYISNKVSKQGDVESTKSAPLYLEIIDRIQSYNDIYEDFIFLEPTKLCEKYHKNSDISDATDNYIKEFGPRVMDELKLETETLFENPVFLYQMLKNTIINGLKIETHDIKQVDEPKINIFQRIKLKKLIKKTKFFIKNRELLRLRRTYLYSVYRRIYLRIGEIFEKEHLIEDKRDIFHLKKEEIEMVIDDKINELRNLKGTIIKRKQRMEEGKNKKTYNRIVFYGNKELHIHNPVQSDNVLKGIPSGAGVVRGKIKYVEDPTTANLNGEIMLAKRTDPGWIMLFPMCKGLIVERGSILSHSAVVARELGIVAVVGVEDACTILKDGMEVTVDGIKGEIIIHEE